MYIGIKNDKVFDIVSDLRYKRDPDDNDVKYIECVWDNIFINDTWKDGISLKDSPYRTPSPAEKTELELKIEELEARIIELEKSKITEVKR